MKVTACNEINFGTYNCAYNIMLPYLVKDPCDNFLPPCPR